MTSAQPARATCAKRGFKRILLRSRSVDAFGLIVVLDPPGSTHFPKTLLPKESERAQFAAF